MSTAVGIPVIAHGGAGTPAHLASALLEGHADAIAVASMFHYSAIESLTRESHGAIEGNQEFLRGGGRHGRFMGHSVPSLKAALRASGIAMRSPTRVPA